MNNYREILRKIAWRILLASPLLIIFFVGIYQKNILAPFVGFAAVLIIAPAVASLLAEPFSHLYGSNRRYDGPKGIYSIPAAKRAKSLYEDAIAELEKIASEHPDELKVYIDLIEIAIVDLEDRERAKLFFYRGVAALQKDEDKNTLTQMFSSELFPKAQ